MATEQRLAKYIIPLFTINALAWFALGLANVWYMIVNGVSGLRLLYGVLMFLVVAVIGCVGFFVSQKVRWAYYGAIILFGLMAVLSITDQVGWIDLGMLLLSGITLLLLIKERSVLNE